MSLPESHTLVVAPCTAMLEESLERHILRVRAASPLAPITIAVPDPLCGHYLQRRIARAGRPLFDVRFVTLDELARLLAIPALAGEGLRALPRLAPLFLCRRLAREDAGSTCFGPIRHAPGFAASIERIFDELADAGIPGLMNALAALAAGPGPRALAELEARYRSWIAPFHDRARLLEAAAAEAVRARDLLGPTGLAVHGFERLSGRERELLASIAAQVPVRVHLFHAEDWAWGEASSPLARWWLALGCRPVSAWEEPGEPTSGPAPGTLGSLQMRLAGIEENEGALEPDDSVDVVAASSRRAEARAVARRVMRAVREGVRFDEMAVVVRSEGQASTVLREVFAEADIPLYSGRAFTAAASSYGRALTRLVGLGEGRWRRADVLDFLTSAPLDLESLFPGEEADPLEWEAVSREAGITDGAARWAERTRELVRRLERRGAAGRLPADVVAVCAESEAPEQRDPQGAVASGRADRLLARDSSRRSAAARQLHRLMRALTAEPDLIGEREEPEPIATRASRILELARRYLRDDAPGAEACRQALEWLAELGDLAAGPQTECSGGGPAGATCDGEEFRALLVEALSRRAMSDGHFQRGAVALLDLARLGPMRFRRLFVCGLEDGAFPSLPREEPLLLDEEREALNRLVSGDPRFPLSLASNAPAEEVYRFGRAVQAAEERIVFSFAIAENAGSDRTRSPSLYLLDIAAALEGEPLDLAGFEASPWVTRVDDGPAGNVDDALDRSDYLELAWPAAPPEISPFPARAAECRAGRSRAGRWTRFEGSLLTPSTAPILEGLFPPGGRGFAVTELEAYARCPAHYFFEKMLGASPPEEPDRRRPGDPRLVGSLVHRALQRFFESLHGSGDAAGPLEARHGELEAFLREAFRPILDEASEGNRVAWELELQELLRDLRIYLREEAAELGAVAPAAFEWAFGEGSGEPDVAVAIGPACSLRLHGRIDRVDAGAGEGGPSRFRVVDYKTGKRNRLREDDLSGGEHLQGAVYLLAAARAYGGGRPELGEALFEHVRRSAGHARVKFRGSGVEVWSAELERILSGLYASMRGGLFMPSPRPGREKCAVCDYRFACGPATWRLFERKSADPAAAALKGLRTASAPAREETT